MAGVKLVIALPTVLAVSVFGVVSCGDDESETEALPQCNSVSQTGVCEVCIDSGGDKACAGDPSCFYDADRDVCDDAVA